MKRLHVHISVKHLGESIRFYSTLFGAEPEVTKLEYAKWMLEDPRVNFAITTGGAEPGLNHLGFQVEQAEELEEIAGRLKAANEQVEGQKDAACCYARSDKAWVTDPAGIAWETFHTMEQMETFGADVRGETPKEKEGASPGCC